jgi:hypothetical protein
VEWTKLAVLVLRASAVSLNFVSLLWWGRLLAVELRVLVLRRLVQNEASGLRGLVGDVTDPHDGHPQGWWRYNQPGGEDGHQLALALVRCKCVISDRRARREKTIF